MKLSPQFLPCLILGSNLRSGRRGARSPHTPARRRGGRASSAISLVRCPRARAGFPLLEEMRLRLVEFELRNSYAGCTENEWKSLLKCSGALTVVLLVSWGRQPAGEE